MKVDLVETANAALALVAVAGAGAATLVGTWWRHATKGPDLTKRVEMHAYLYERGVELGSMQDRTVEALIGMLATRTASNGDEVPITTCRECLRGIEWFNQTWWEIGTCRSVCTTNQQDHDPILDPYDPAPTQDHDALDEWLRRAE